MKKFEIHITGKNSLILHDFEALDLKTLTVHLLDKYLNIVGTEHMCCIQKSFESYEKCLEYTLSLTARLKAGIARVKIESCYYLEFIDKAIYAEVHCSPHVFGLPFVFNVNSKKYVSTERTYTKSEFLDLKERYEGINGSEFELCLYDSNPNFDDHWLSFYKEK
jgi:hypothetical protein